MAKNILSINIQSQRDGGQEKLLKKISNPGPVGRVRETVQFARMPTAAPTSTSGLKPRRARRRTGSPRYPEKGTSRLSGSTGRQKVGLRYNYQISDRWAIRLYGDIGGFGAASDFTWQTVGMIDYQPWKNVSIGAGYRAIGTDYETGSGADKFTYDATIY